MAQSRGVDVKRFDGLISLGGACQTAYQLRRYTGDNLASYFDWLGSPHRGLVFTLRMNFLGCFERQQLQITPDGLSVVNQETGLTYRHYFPRVVESSLIDRKYLDRDFERVRAKMDRRAERWLMRIRSERLLFVRHGLVTAEEALELFSALRTQAGSNPVELLVITPPDGNAESLDPGIHYIPGIPLTGDRMDWQGDDELWNQVLQLFWDKAPARPMRRTETPNDLGVLESARVLFQVPNYIGLGHMNRMAAVATTLRDIAPQLRVLFAVEGATHGLLEAFRLAYVSLPHPSTIRSMLGASSWAKSTEVNLGMSIAQSILRSFMPSLVIYDCFPNRYMADVVLSLGIPTVLCVRNVNNPEEYVRRAEVAKVLNSCASVIVPHEREDAMTLPLTGSKSIYVGNIVRNLPVDPEPVQLRFRIPSSRVIVITAGGGGHETASSFLNLSIQAVGRVQNNIPEIVPIVVPGPLFTRWSMLQSVPNLRIIPFDPRLMEYCATADLVISQAGYNSMNELASLGTPTIALPVERGFDDQFQRAEQMASLWNNIHVANDYNLEALCALIEQLLLERPQRVRREVPEGALRAAQHIIELVNDIRDL